MSESGYDHEQEERRHHVKVVDGIVLMENMLGSAKKDKQLIAMGIATGLLRQGHIKSFADFEKALRQTHSEVHLVAMPTNAAEIPEGMRVCDPLSGDRRDYLLQVCLHAAEAQRLLDQIEVDANTNLARLEYAGILTDVDNDE